jgi:putative ABC transport system permease protein
MTRIPRPPRLARWILERVLPADVREGISGDLEEMFRRRSRLWYWRQTASFSGHFLAERLRRRKGMDMSLGMSWLDFKLGLRMLRRYPGLTFVGGLGMAVAMAVGVTSFAFFYASMHPTLPLDEGERIVGLENWDTSWNNQEDRIIHDFVAWRGELKSIEDLAAFREVQRNMISPGQSVEQISVGEMTASAFRLARVSPVLGRPLIESDERQGAAEVVVIGYTVWKNRFAARTSVIGESVRLGATVHTIVGVMPEGFAFPASGRAWVPLRADPLDYERRRGPGIMVAGRLAPGATFEIAQAELTTIGNRMAAAFPKSHERLRPRVVRYTEMWFDDERRSDLGIVQVLISALVVVVGINVAILVYARTATRQTEILVRSALGASRRRIVAQLFAEALVLSTASAAAGLALAQLALAQAKAAAAQMGPRLGAIPFWMTFDLPWGAVVYALGLAVLGAAIVGILPAVNATGRRMHARLGQVSAGSGMKLGTTWTALIVIQVAFAVAVLPGAAYLSWESLRRAGSGPGFPAGQFLSARMVMEREIPPSIDAPAYARAFDARYLDAASELTRLVKADPEIAGVTYASTIPGDEPEDRVELEGVPRPPAFAAGLRVKVLDIGVDLFDVFDVPIFAGRPFHAADPSTGSGSPASQGVIVNRAFVRLFLADGNAVGHRVRFLRQTRGTDPPEPWHEIVGVVEDLPANPISLGEIGARLYRPSQLGENGTTLLLRSKGADAGAYAARLQQIAAAVDPTLRLTRMVPLAEAYRQEQSGVHWGALVMALVTGSVVLLSAAGIYALVSVTVTRRRREIGIRVALGADRGRILRAIFARATAQLISGVAVGVLLAACIDRALNGDFMGGQWAVLLPIGSAFMMTVGLLAALGPARRGLRIQPTQALREE